jgi:hypothetical protein
MTNLVCNHGWFRTGAMAQNEARCIHCGVWSNSEAPKKFVLPDEITDNSESPEYRAGWNECREAMMEMMK